MATKGPGRPTKESKQRRSETLKVLVSPRDSRHIHYAAERSRISLSTFVLNAALKEADTVLAHLEPQMKQMENAE